MATRRSARSLAAEAAFRTRLDGLGATLLEPEWLGVERPHRVRCRAGHDCTPRPDSIQQGRGPCKTCAGENRTRSAESFAAEVNFRARLTELGATPLYEEWLGKDRPHHVRCAAGHDCYPRPGGIRGGQGCCKTCGTQGRARAARSFDAEAAFYSRLRELGAELLEPEWLGTQVPHHVMCAEGHECRPRPDCVLQGQGICRTCANLAHGRARFSAGETSFRLRLEQLGAVLLEPEYLGSKHPHRVRCASGHECQPWPNHVLKGGGICSVCAGNDPATAEANFRARLAELGATPLYEKWLGSQRPHHVRCANGHDCQVRPGCVQQGQGCCKTCSTLNRARAARSFAAEAEFRVRLGELGAILLEPKWLGNKGLHEIRCAEGHEYRIRPNDVQQGNGPCLLCAGKTWDVFYVVTHASKPRVKFGITSGDPRPRLNAHRRAGYVGVVYLVTGLPGAMAPDAETAIKSALALAGERPVQGREYFDISCLPLILDVACGWLTSNDNDKAA